MVMMMVHGMDRAGWFYSGGCFGRAPLGKKTLFSTAKPPLETNGIR